MRKQVRRRFLRKLNLARVAWDHGAGAVFLLRPTPDPRDPGKVLVLRPGQVPCAVASKC